MTKKDCEVEDELLELMRKQWGDESIFEGTNAKLRVDDAISTGSFALDEALGDFFGIPRKRLTQFAGGTGCGKTFLAMQTVKQWQMRHPDNKAWWIDAEFSFNTDWAERLGIDLSRLQLIKRNEGAYIFDALCGVPHPTKAGQKAKLGLLDLIIQRKDEHTGLIVLDSIAAIIPPVEAAYSVGHQNMAPLPRFLGAAVRRLCPLVEEANVAFIVINQLRVSPTAYGDPSVTPGGKALGHHESVAINFAISGAAEDKILNSDEEKIGHIVVAKTVKNRFSSPRSCRFTLKFLEGVTSNDMEVFDLAIRYKLIQRPNNKMYIIEGESYNGRAKALDALKNTTLKEKLVATIRKLKQDGTIVGGDPDLIQEDDDVSKITTTEEEV